MRWRRVAILIGGLAAIFALLVTIWMGPTVLSWLAYRPIDMRAVGAFAFDDQRGTLADVPWQVRRLDGRRVVVHGFMIPMDPGGRFTRFAIVTSLNAGGWAPPRVTEVIVAKLRAGRTCRYVADDIWVYGTLRVHVDTEGGFMSDAISMAWIGSSP